MKEIYIDDSEYKIFVISDIHGDHKLLKKLINKLNIMPEDYLILLGDYINKGDGGLETLEYIKKLNKRKKTYVLKGNHEYAMFKMFTQWKTFLKMYEWIKVNKKNLVNDILIADGKKHLFYDKKLLFDYLSSKTEIIDQLDGILTLLYFDDHIFVHAGYQKHISENNEYKYLKWDTYNEDSEINEKVVVVGHMPSSNFRNDKLYTSPYFNKEKNIIFIDGGVGIKKVSELNALIIEKRNGKLTYDNVQENNFIKKEIVREISIEKDQEDVFITYPNFEVEVIRNDGIFSVCRYLKNGKEFRVFTSMIDGNMLTYNYTNNFLTIPKGEFVYLCYYYEDYALVKYKGEFGWIKRECISG